MTGKTNGKVKTAWTPCTRCPLKKFEIFRSFDEKELDFVKRFKTGELISDRGSTVLVEGSHSAHLYTLLSGWGFRYKMLDDGRRQILNYVLPGDMIGLQGTLMGEMQHSIEALTPMIMCVFERERLSELFRSFPSLSYDLTWIAAREESILDEHLLSVGQRNALERSAYLLLFLHKRAKAVRALVSSNTAIPITQQHVADTLGLSVVHTNKTLRKLVSRDLIEWTGGQCKVRDENGLSTIANWAPPSTTDRPYI
ncbi:Crp/Fnr family transcriptional regulator [Hoeflea sp. WL0058]|uniref:Crp/Fnr family transcriptional regulator n=1 Tax=Flavimaribacter sediminis TaxID=2865987 RepID=A0AAE2ZLJ7_9HYPH|nr:Crp/Fnr family transcriptional regulator [Flavimaribacter sediminis]MBW8636685.1 Crp/Fnr family transcriptional regulator [Flavimaribacter sediminis]